MYVFIGIHVHMFVYIYAFVSQRAVIVRLPVSATASSAVMNVTRASSSQTAQKVCFVSLPIMYITCIHLNL